MAEVGHTGSDENHKTEKEKRMPDWMDEISADLDAEWRKLPRQLKIDPLESIRDALWVIAKGVNPEGVRAYEAGEDCP